MSRLHPTSEQLVPSRYLIDDIEHMVAAAVSDSEAGHNVYIEARTVREGLRGSARGTLEDTRAVFASSSIPMLTKAWAGSRPCRSA
jgi:hypothetical protein